MEPEPDGMVVERFLKDFALLFRLDSEEEEDEFGGIFSSSGKGYIPGNCGTYSPGLEALAPRKEYLSALKRYLSCSSGVMICLSFVFVGYKKRLLYNVPVQRCENL